MLQVSTGKCLAGLGMVLTRFEEHSAMLKQNTRFSERAWRTSKTLQHVFTKTVVGEQGGISFESQEGPQGRDRPSSSS